MRPFAGLLLALFVSACATLGVGGGGESGRMEVWRQAHHAFSVDSFRVAEALFQRLAQEHPRTHEGHEARFYLGVLNVEPRHRVDLTLAAEHLRIYLAEDSVREFRGYHYREGESLLTLVRELQQPCGRRAAGLGGCQVVATTDTVTRTTPGAPAPAGAISAAEAARLRRELAAANTRITELTAELERIRSTLTPPRRPRE